MAGLPYRPDIAVLLEVAGRCAIPLPRPANDAVDGVEIGGRRSLETRRARGIAKRCQVQEHRHTAACLAGQDQGVPDEPIREARSVGRIGDDVLCPRLLLPEKIDARRAVTAINEVGGDNGIPATFQL